MRWRPSSIILDMLALSMRSVINASYVLFSQKTNVLFIGWQPGLIYHTRSRPAVSLTSRQLALIDLSDPMQAARACRPAPSRQGSLRKNDLPMMFCLRSRLFSLASPRRLLLDASPNKHRPSPSSPSPAKVNRIPQNTLHHHRTPHTNSHPRPPWVSRECTPSPDLQHRDRPQRARISSAPASSSATDRDSDRNA